MYEWKCFNCKFKIGEKNRKLTDLEYEIVQDHVKIFGHEGMFYQ